MPLLEQLLKKYPDNVKLVFKNFPIRSHKYAVKAAAAALVAERQGKFWTFHDLLFENYSHLNDQKIEELAEKAGLNKIELQRQQNDPAINDQIRQDYREGLDAGVRGTPTVFINGKKVRNRSLEGMVAAIEEELKKQEAENNKQ